MKIPAVYLIAGGAVLAALAYVAMKGAKGTGEAVGRVVPDLAAGVLKGTVEGTGELFGIPKTDPTACELAKAKGRTWDASFACPAGEFLAYLWK